MRTQISLFVFTSCIASAAMAASPTPGLSTGNYAGQRALVVVADPTKYGGDGVAANTHPITVRYDSVSQSYVLYDYEGAPGTTFSPGEKVTAQSSAAYTFYRDAQTGETLKLLNQSAANPVIALTYVTYGKWVQPATAPIRLVDNYVVFGKITPAAGMPRTGSASYKAILDGTYGTSAGVYHLSGNATFVANFGTSLMGLTVTPIATNLANGSQLTFGTLTGSGYIYLDTSSFNATSRTRLADGSKTLFSSYGNFYGPKATEIGGVFKLTRTLGTTSLGEGAGAFVGH